MTAPEGLDDVPGPALLQPRFRSPRVRACMTGRAGGVSVAPFDRFNLRPGLGDDDQAVRHNRARLQHWLGMPSVMLNQVHGTAVQRLPLPPDPAGVPTADASFCLTPGLACEVQVADCLPVLLADRDGRGVAAAHAGWRGLAAGVIEASVQCLCRELAVPPAQIEAWLGPCIGPQAFEVRDEVLRAFGADPARPDAAFRPGRPGHWLADLAALARRRLAGLGVVAVQGNDSSEAWCTHSQPDRFFSFRRDGRTGRMAACIGLVE